MADKPLYPTQPDFPVHQDNPPSYMQSTQVTQDPYKPQQSNMMNAPPVIIQAQPGIIFVPPAHFGDNPQQAICPSCRANVVTQVKHETGVATWLIAGGLCLLGLWCGCCLIPFCIDGAKDAEHYCPNCRALVGRNKKI